MNDNIYPLSGQPFALRPPQKQIEERKEEIAKTLDQLPLIKEVISRLDTKLAATDSVKKALEVSDKYQISRENALIVLDIVNQQLATERSFLQTKVEQVSQR